MGIMQELAYDFQQLSIGSSGVHTELLQLALRRAKYDIVLSGVFDNRTYDALKNFQTASGIQPDGVAGSATWRALLPYLLGYALHSARPGDNPDNLAALYGSTAVAIMAANPGLSQIASVAGQNVTIPLDFDVVPTNINFTSTVLSLCVCGLRARYPFLGISSAGKSVMGRDIHIIKIGSGTREVFYNAAHHANEWITTPILMAFLESYAKKCAFGGKIFDINAQSLYINTALSVVPMVNPDGVDLVTGALSEGDAYDRAAAMARQYPDIPFPTGWKANINGVDLNLQYPAGWENAQAIKYSQGVTRPGPRDFVGFSPLSEPESQGLFDLTLACDFALTLSFHTQGKTIYWKYLDYEPKNSWEIAQKFAHVSGYLVEETPIASGYAGYKDWFISTYNRPGCTIEAGEGVSPLPLTQFSQIYDDCLGILVLGLL